MKKLLFVAVAAGFALSGCSDPGSLVGPSETPVVVPTESPDCMNASMPVTMLDQDAINSGMGLVTTSKRIYARFGGTVVLKGAYPRTVYSYMYRTVRVDTVHYYLAITFGPGDLPSDQTITITFDKSSFAYNADVQFGPSGLVFANPALLTLRADNVNISRYATQVYLNYWDNGTWTRTPYSWGTCRPGANGMVYAQGEVPHFSRYAFGR